MDARTQCNVEVAALLPDGAKVTPIKAGSTLNKAANRKSTSITLDDARVVERMVTAEAERMVEFTMLGSSTLDARRIKAGLHKAAFGFGPTLDDLMG